MLLVVLVGVALILVARDERADNAPAGPPRLGDHWHSLYAIYNCDEFVLDVYPNDVEDQSGIHTHGDGLIHIHPFHTGVTGQFATVGAFMDEIEVEMTDATIELPDGTLLDESGDGCESPDPSSDDADVAEPGAELRILRWETLQAEKALTFAEDLRGVRFLDDGQIFVFAFVHPSVADSDIPRPDDAFLRQYLNLPLEDQPLGDPGVGPMPLPDADGAGESDDGGLLETSEPAESEESDESPDPPESPDPASESDEDSSGEDGSDDGGSPPATTPATS